MVVAAQNLQATPNKAGPAPIGNKRKRKKHSGGDLLGRPIASRNGAEGHAFDGSPSSSSSDPSAVRTGGVREYLFSSAHSRVQRLYYLLATRPIAHTEGETTEGASSRTEEGGCHAVVFVEATVIAQELIAELKALSLTAYALHERTPKAQVSGTSALFGESKYCVVLVVLLCRSRRV